jgi:phosphoglycolate phosphatase
MPNLRRTVIKPAAQPIQNRERLKVEVMIFDLDGTLIDSRADIARAVNDTLTSFGADAVPVQEIEKFVGTGVTPLIVQRIRALDPSLVEKAIASFEDIYETTFLNATTTYPGVIKVLEHFLTMPKVVLTNKRTRFVEPILVGLGIRQHFSAVFGAESLPVRKPHPRTIIEICRQLGASVDDAAIIGDTEIDVATGKAAGCKTCAVSYGYGDVERLRALDPDILIDSIGDLTAILY